MRILVLSDSHKDITSCEKVIKNIVGIDMIFHAGDHASDAVRLSDLFPDIPVKFVSGNCDFTPYPSELVIPTQEHRIFLTHGHDYRVKYESDYLTLTQKAVSQNCDCAVFGHAHNPYCYVNRGITLLNPGSIKSSRSYGIIEIDDGSLKACVCDASYII